jgi:hypothetical protein
MKKLSRTFRFIVLGIIVTVVVVSCCNFPFPSVFDTTSYASLEIGHPLGRGHAISPTPTIPPRTYVEWKNERDFDNALAQVRDHAKYGASYCLCVVKPGGTPHPYDSYNNCPKDYKCPSEHIRTIKLTKSKAADNVAAGESAVNDPHVTYKIQSPFPGDIIKVLSTLK